MQKQIIRNIFSLFTGATDIKMREWVSKWVCVGNWILNEWKKQMNELVNA